MSGYGFDPTIDIDNLAEEWLKQPNLYFEWAANLADARRKVDEAKSELDVTKAEMLLEIGKDPAAYDVGKPTVDNCAAAVFLTKEYKVAQAAYLNAKHHADIVGAAVDALGHRKKALENLVDLHSQNYFATPHPKRASKEDADDIVKAEMRRRWHHDKEDDEDDE